MPYADAPEASAVLARVQSMLAALERSDQPALLAQVRADGGATVALEGPDGRRGVRHLSWADFAAQLRPGGDRISERISDPAVEVDGDIAMVWAPYVVTVNGAVQHCGFDHFDLVRDGGTWKVQNITWSQRTTGCTAP